MTVKGGSRPACAACRFQRRRCSSDCPLAPFFPANEPKIFQNVHRLYGVGNVMKILNLLNSDEKKEDAMKSIKYESNMRELYPVDGCFGRIAQLKQNLIDLMRELQYVRVLLHAYRKNKDPNQDSFIMSSLVTHDHPLSNNDHGGSSNCMNDHDDPMINDHRFYYFGSSSRDNNDQKLYDWDDEQLKLTQMQYQFDEIGLSSGVEQDDGSPEYDNTCESHQWFVGLQGDHESRVESQNVNGVDDDMKRGEI